MDAKETQIFRGFLQSNWSATGNCCMLSIPHTQLAMRKSPGFTAYKWRDTRYHQDDWTKKTWVCTTCEWMSRIGARCQKRECLQWVWFDNAADWTGCDMTCFSRSKTTKRGGKLLTKDSLVLCLLFIVLWLSNALHYERIYLCMYWVDGKVRKDKKLIRKTSQPQCSV